MLAVATLQKGGSILFLDDFHYIERMIFQGGESYGAP